MPFALAVFFLGDAEPPFSTSESVSLSPLDAAFLRDAVRCFDFLGAPPRVCRRVGRDLGSSLSVVLPPAKAEERAAEAVGPFLLADAAEAFLRCAAVVFGVAAGFRFTAVAFFSLATSESELSELLPWLSLEDNEELESEEAAAAAAAAAACLAAAAAAALVCFFGGVDFRACFLFETAAAAAYNLEAFGVALPFFCGDNRGGLGLLPPRPRLFPLSESLALLSLKMFLNRETCVAGAFVEAVADLAGVAVGVADALGVVPALGVVAAAGVDGFGVCPPADDAEGVMLPFACSAFFLKLESDRSW